MRSRAKHSQNHLQKPPAEKAGWFLIVFENRGIVFLMKKLLKLEVIAVFLVLIAGMQFVLFSGVLRMAGEAISSVSDMMAAVLPGVLASETNQYRATHNVATLRSNTLLAQAATLKAQDMAKKGYFSHVGPEGEKPWAWLEKVGYEYTYAGENLAVDFTDSSDVTNAWIASPTHQRNLVSQNFKEIGVGTAEGVYRGLPTTFVVQFFGTPADDSLLAPSLVSTSTLASSVVSASSTTSRSSAVRATTTSTTTLISAVSTSTGTSARQVLGTYTSSTPLDVLRQNLYVALFISPRHFINDISLGLTIFLLAVLILSFLHTARLHPAESIFEKIKHSHIEHKKSILAIIIFILALGVLWVLDAKTFSHRVIVGEPSNSYIEKNE